MTARKISADWVEKTGRVIDQYNGSEKNQEKKLNWSIKPKIDENFVFQLFHWNEPLLHLTCHKLQGNSSKPFIQFILFGFIQLYLHYNASL